MSGNIEEKKCSCCPFKRLRPELYQKVNAAFSLSLNKTNKEM